MKALDPNQPPPLEHDQVVELALELLVAEAAAGRWQTASPGAECAVRAQFAYATAQVYLGALEGLRPPRGSR